MIANYFVNFGRNKKSKKIILCIGISVWLSRFTPEQKNKGLIKNSQNKCLLYNNFCCWTFWKKFWVQRVLWIKSNISYQYGWWLWNFRVTLPLLNVCDTILLNLQVYVWPFHNSTDLRFHWGHKKISNFLLPRVFCS